MIIVNEAGKTGVFLLCLRGMGWIIGARDMRCESYLPQRDNNKDLTG